MLDTLTIIGIVIAAAVVLVLVTLCKIRGCNKPIC
jgi:hypothetical protein